MNKLISKTKREKEMISWLWRVLSELDVLMDSYVPHATSCEERADELIKKLRRKFPEIHLKYSKRMAKQLKRAMTTHA